MAPASKAFPECIIETLFYIADFSSRKRDISHISLAPCVHEAEQEAFYTINGMVINAGSFTISFSLSKMGMETDFQETDFQQQHRLRFRSKKMKTKSKQIKAVCINF
jgi:hypothetical protein